MDPVLKKQLEDLAANIGDIEKTKGAVAQLERQFTEMGRDMDKKLAHARSVGWNERGQYRGCFPSEDHARGFGLLVMREVQKHASAGDALRSEFPEIAKAFSTADGAALIPEDYNATIVDLIETYGVFESNALAYPMASDRTPYPKKTGRTRAFAMEESDAVQESKPTVARKILTARKWGAYTEAPSEIEEDSAAAFGELVAMDMAEAHAEAADEAGLLGDGSAAFNQITGVVNKLIAEAIAVSAASAWSGLTLEDHTNAISRCVRGTFTGIPGSGPKWYCSTQYFWQVMVPITLASGGVTAGEIEGRRQLLFLGYPVELAAVMPSASAADQIPAIFGNLRKGAVFGDRRKFTFKKSEDFKFSEDVLAMLSTRRYDIQVHGAGEGEKPEVLAAVQTAE